MKRQRQRRREPGVMELAQPAEAVPHKKRSVIRNIFLWTFEILVVILFAYVVVYFFGQSRTNVGQSMDVTLSGGDTVLLNVLSYRLGSPKRGDVISFKPNGSTTGRSSIKRVIGLPGETVQIKDGMIYIDGVVYLEKKSYPVITNPGMAAEEITLGDKEYFVLGDNRNNSEDSRFADVGLVHSSFIEGKVWFVLSPSEHRGFLKE
ncbi:MAG: signal peptidase I [Lachnospiraceae bacterium]|uniref:signal peptidase I n=1 Tax=Parablautia sp. Marseille-Q6255 TaxID=3039593 RepID=UPI0024BCF12B|nr:signal peptidase I [Parablautia sp. Marseille-Q6255]